MTMRGAKEELAGKAKPAASPSQSEGECFDVNPRFCVKAQASSAQDQTSSTHPASEYAIRL
jgi:hypothetical protein